MDPNSPLARSTLNVSTAIWVIHQWFAKGHGYYWNRYPEEVIADLRKEGCDITYMRAVKILRSAETSKCPGGANAGMSWIKDEWKKYVLQPD